jgi:hypothetical protein
MLIPATRAADALNQDGNLQDVGFLQDRKAPLPDSGALTTDHRKEPR